MGRCIKRNDKMFWEKLIYEMPHRGRTGERIELQGEEEGISFSSNSSLFSSYSTDGNITLNIFQ